MILFNCKKQQAETNGKIKKSTPQPEKNFILKNGDSTITEWRSI